MTTTETTIAMVNRLTEAELIDVQKYIKQIFATRARRPAKMKKYTEQDFLKLIDESIEQSQNGNIYSWADVQKAAHAKYCL